MGKLLSAFESLKTFFGQSVTRTLEALWGYFRDFCYSGSADSVVYIWCVQFPMSYDCSVVSQEIAQ